MNVLNLLRDPVGKKEIYMDMLLKIPLTPVGK
jgi:hypothetical protein